MILRMFSVFDSAASAFLPPVFLQTEAVLLRELRGLPEKQPQHVWVRHAEQFTVFELGTFDDLTGVVKGEPPEAIVNLKVLFSQGKLALVERAEGTDPDLVMERVS